MASSASSSPPVSASSAPVAGYAGFVAGVFSGVTKLTVGHPFDTIKVRLQTASPNQFRGPLDCLTKTVAQEGITALYKGATPPLAGWMLMDSVMLGSLTLYRGLVNKHIFNRDKYADYINAVAESTYASVPTPAPPRLPLMGHVVAGCLAGLTVSFVAAPIEHIKARLQVQYSADVRKRLYSGPIDCAKKIFAEHGVTGIYRGLASTLIFRSFFWAWWGSYDILSRTFEEKTSMSSVAINFWAGGLSAQCFWVVAYPSDVVKQRIMTDGLGPADRKYHRWKDAVKSLWRQQGMAGFWRGFVPSSLRAFPANASALMVFEAVMRTLN